MAKINEIHICHYCNKYITRYYNLLHHEDICKLNPKNIIMEDKNYICELCGEIHVGPYSLDGYDKELNIAFEYDENSAHHNSEKNKVRDKLRQEYIIEKLNCEFWRYSEKNNLLYKIINE